MILRLDSMHLTLLCIKTYPDFQRFMLSYNVMYAVGNVSTNRGWNQPFMKCFKRLQHCFFVSTKFHCKSIFFFQVPIPVTSLDISVKRVRWYTNLLPLSPSRNCSHIVFPLILFLSPPHSKPCMWALQQAWRRWSCIAVRRMEKPVLSAALPEILTVHGMDPPVHDSFQTANVASAGKTSNMETRCCSVWIRTLAVSVHSSLWILIKMVLLLDPDTVQAKNDLFMRNHQI